MTELRVRVYKKLLGTLEHPQRGCRVARQDRSHLAPCGGVVVHRRVCLSARGARMLDVRDIRLGGLVGTALLVLLVPLVRERTRRILRPPQASADKPHPAAEHAESMISCRVFTPLASVLAALEETTEDALMTSFKRTTDQAIVETRRNFVRDAAEREVHVPLPLWITYRNFVDTVISARAGRAGDFHSFVYGRVLGLPSTDRIKAEHRWSGSDAADLLACLAQAGLLVGDDSLKPRRSTGGPPTSARVPPSTPEEALVRWLEQSLEAFDARFNMAHDRVYVGLTRDLEGEWSGPYDFVQLADPQLGMLHWDKEWSEELTMLRLAIQHVNRLKPRFLFISGDLINAFPTDESKVCLTAD